MKKEVRSGRLKLMMLLLLVIGLSVAVLSLGKVRDDRSEAAKSNNSACPGTWTEGWKVWNGTRYDCSGVAKPNPYGHPGLKVHSCIRLDNGSCSARANADYGEASCVLASSCGNTKITISPTRKPTTRPRATPTKVLKIKPR